MRYDVEFETAEGEMQTAQYHSVNPGAAFALCQKANPGCTMLHATAHSGVQGFEARTDYEPPPVQRDPIKEPKPCRAPKPDEKDGTMPFYDQVKSEKPWN